MRLIDADAFLKALNETPSDFVDVGGDFGFFDETIDSVMNEQPTIDAVPTEKYNALKERYERWKEIADILDTALRQYQRKCGE